MTFEIQSKESEGEDCTLKEMLDQIVRRKRIEAITNSVADNANGSKPNVQYPSGAQAEPTIPTPRWVVSMLNSIDANHGDDVITAGDIINRMMPNNGAKEATILVQNSAEIRAGGALSLLSVHSPRPLLFQWLPSSTTRILLSEKGISSLSGLMAHYHGFHE